MAYGYNESLEGGPQPPVQIHRVGGWKLLLGAMLGAAGLGFGGYVLLGPYQKLTHTLRAQASALGEERAASEDLSAERDKLKAELSRRAGAEQEKAAAEGKRKEAVEAFSAELKAALGAFGGTASVVGAKAEISFATASVFEDPASSVISPQGEAALKVLGGAVKKWGFRARAKAKLIPAPPPRNLAQFKNIGEFAMLRAVRAALALADGGVPADRIAAAGEAPPPNPRKAKPAVPDRLDIEIEPE